MYTDDAMIAVLQKAEEFATNRKPADTLKTFMEGKDEHDCFNIAYSQQYFQKDAHNNLVVFTHAGRIELAELLKAREAKQRELERHEREKLKISLDVAALVVSLFSIVFAACALGIAALNCYWLLSGGKQPGRIVCTIECLPDQTTPAQNGNEKTETGKTNADTSEPRTNIQEN